MAHSTGGKKNSFGIQFLPCLLSLLVLCQLTSAARYEYQSRKVPVSNGQCSIWKRLFQQRRIAGSSRSRRHRSPHLSCRGAPVLAFAPSPPPSSSLSVLSLLADVDSGQASAAISESTLWLLRIGSAFTTYVGALALLDRPQGQLMVDSSQDIVIQDSTVSGAGLGLFAKTNLGKGTVLGTYPGAVLPLQQNLVKLKNYPPCEGYIWRFSDNRMVIDPTNAQGDLDFLCVGGNPSMPGSLWLFENILSKFVFTNVPSALCRINEPPRGRDVNVVTDENLKDRTVTFQLERDVFAGEEFFIDYGLSYDRTMYGGTPSSSNDNE
jgi:hypothetical protein